MKSGRIEKSFHCMAVKSSRGGGVRRSMHKGRKEETEWRKEACSYMLSHTPACSTGPPCMMLLLMKANKSDPSEEQAKS